MKNLLLIILSFYFSVLLDAQVLKTTNSTVGNLTSKTDTTQRTTPEITNKGKINAPDINTLPQSRQLSKELENVVHGNLQIQSDFLNRPSTSQELMSLTGNDKTSAQRLLMGMDGLKSARNFESARIELEKQTIVEMENYRNEIINRLIMEEYSRLNNNQTSGIPENSLSKTSKLAQYRILRELIQEQQVRAAKTRSTNSKNTLAIPLPMEGLAKQLDQKIREEEIREEIITRQRITMEQKNQIQQQNKN